MPNYPPFLEQNCNDCRLNVEDNRRVASHYMEAVQISEKCHQLLTLFGGKAPHQHSFVHGGAAVAPTVDKINQALTLIRDIRKFIGRCLMPDTELIANCYADYFSIGKTPGRLLSFGLFRFGSKNEQLLWKDGVLNDHYSKPKLDLLQEDISHAWYERSHFLANPEVSNCGSLIRIRNRVNS
ncbi:nickel-dependent hydrogenase large subunit [Sporomusa acidovorans]|nr:nickel-dependent hydrogenase large subunit [Sporomusa acidovorans]